MNLREFLGAIRAHWITFVTVTLVVLGAGIAWLALSPLQYVSNAQLLVTLNGTTTANAYQNDSVVASRVNSYVALMTSDAVAQRVVDALKSPLSAKEMAATVTAVQVPNTAVIDIAAVAPSREQARRVAQTFAEEFVAYAASIESPTGEDAQRIQTAIVSSAGEPESRLGERIAVGGLVALAAIFIGAAAVWVRRDPRVRGH